MKNLKSLLQAGKLFVLALAGWLLSSSQLFADKGTSAAEGSDGPSWVMPYFLVLLGIVLGMLVVCRASTRRDRARPEAYSEGKAGQTHAEK